MKIVLNDINSVDQVSVINDNFDKLEQELNNKVLYRNNTTSDPNALVTNLDANGRRIYNLPKPVANSEPLRLQDLKDFNAGTGGGTGGPVAVVDVSFFPFGTIEATNVQAAIEEVFAEAGGGGGGGGGLPAIGGVGIANQVLDQTTPNSRIVIASTNPNGWNTGAGRCTLDFEFVSNSYFAANPNGHVAIVTRLDADVIATAVRGQGALFGSLIGVNNAPDYAPMSQLETWANGLMPNNNFLFKNSATGRNKLLQDNVRYRMIVESTKTSDANRYIRVRIMQFDASTESWLSIHDSGDVLDHNRWADLTEHGIAFGQVFGSNLVPWSISFENIKVTWGPAYEASADLSTRLHKYGAELEGDLNFIGEARRIRVKNDITSGLDNVTAFQARESNRSSSVFVIPSGTSRAANFYATNSSGNLTNHGAMAIGMNGDTGIIGSARFGTQASVPIAVTIDEGNIMTFRTSVVDIHKTLEFKEVDSKIKFYNNGIVPSQWTALQGATVNKATLIPVLPNGTSTEATLVLSNNSNIASTYQSVTLGMVANTAVLQASGMGTTPPPLQVNMGNGFTVATFDTNGILMRGAGQYIGTDSVNLTGQYNLAGFNARSSAGSALDMEALATPGGIATLITSLGGTTEQKIESATRPLVSIISCLLYDLKSKKVL